MVCPQANELPVIIKSWESHGMDSPLEPPGGDQPHQHLHLRRLASRTVRDRFLLLEAAEIVVICYSSPRKLIQPSKPTVWKSISLATSPLGMLSVQHSGGSWAWLVPHSGLQ